jgi:dethiobiotin synthetase
LWASGIIVEPSHCFCFPNAFALRFICDEVDMRLAYFLTGTDTGIGKTRVLAALGLWAQQQGLRVGAYKQVESGCLRINDQLIPQDGAFLKEILAMPEPLETIVSYRLEAPLAPALAARMSGVSINFQRLRTDFEALAQQYDLLLVEGAGGILAPVWQTRSNRDLAEWLQLPLICVAANRLGMINHTRLTVEAIRARSLPLAGVILNQPASITDLSAQTNHALLAECDSISVLGELPYIPALAALPQAGENGTDWSHLRAVLRGVVEKHLEPTALLQLILKKE